MTPPSDTAIAQFIRNWLHAAGTIVGFLMLAYTGVIAALQQAGATSVHPNPWVAGIGAGIVGLSQTVDSLNNAATTKAQLSSPVNTTLDLPVGAVGQQPAA